MSWVLGTEGEKAGLGSIGRRLRAKSGAREASSGVSGPSGLREPYRDSQIPGDYHLFL